MFKKFKELFASESLLDSAYDTTVRMLEFDFKMYEASRTTLRLTDHAGLPFDFKKTDRKINKYEREVRRNVLTHLTVSGMHNLVPGLALVSIVIDVERIGDYTKNIAHLATCHPERLEGGNHEEALARIEAHIQASFPQIIGVLRSQEVDPARAMMQGEPAVSKSADTIVDDLIMEKSSPSRRDAVSLALYARYLKRINSHLTNIASSIVNPFPRIGFREKTKK